MAKIMFEFTIYSDNWDPNGMIRLLDIEKERINICIKGNPGKYIQTLKESSWTYSTGYVEANNLQHLNESFIDKIGSHVELLREYLRANHLDSKLYVVAYMQKKDIPTFEFDNKILSILSRLNTSIDFDLYVVTKKNYNHYPYDKNKA